MYMPFEGFYFVLPFAVLQEATNMAFRDEHREDNFL